MKEYNCWNGVIKPSCPSHNRQSCSVSREPTSTTSLSRQTKKNSKSSEGSTNSTPRLPSSDHAKSSPSWQASKYTSEGTEYETIAPKWGSKPSTRGQICQNQGLGQSTRSTPTSCETLPLTDQIKSGEWTLLTSGWPQTGCTSSLSLTGTADTSLPGRSQKHWSCPSSWTAATRRSTKRCQKLSTPTRAATSQQNASRAASRRRERRYPWTVVADTWTISSRSACGALSSMRRST